MTSLSSDGAPAVARPDFRNRVASRFLALVHGFSAWRAHRRLRRTLVHLDRHLLEDIGLGLAERTGLATPDRTEGFFDALVRIGNRGR